MIGRLANPVFPERSLEQLTELAADLERHSYPRSEPQPSVKLSLLTPGDKANLVAAYREGATAAALAKRYGLSKGTVLNLLDRNHVAKRRRPPSIETLKQATLLYEHGLSLAAIAERLDVPQSTLRRHLKKKGMVLRPRGGSLPKN